MLGPWIGRGTRESQLNCAVRGARVAVGEQKSAFPGAVGDAHGAGVKVHAPPPPPHRYAAATRNDGAYVPGLKALPPEKTVMWPLRVREGGGTQSPAVAAPDGAALSVQAADSPLPSPVGLCHSLP